MTEERDPVADLARLIDEGHFDKSHPARQHLERMRAEREEAEERYQRRVEDEPEEPEVPAYAARFLLVDGDEPIDGKRWFWAICAIAAVVGLLVGVVSLRLVA